MSGWELLAAAAYNSYTMQSSKIDACRRWANDDNLRLLILEWVSDWYFYDIEPPFSVHPEAEC